MRNINTFFAKYEEAQVTEELKSRLYGEMKFIRAFVYSNLIWRFGGVPIITKAYTLEDTDYSITRNTYEECVDFIFKKTWMRLLSIYQQKWKVKIKAVPLQMLAKH